MVTQWAASAYNAMRPTYITHHTRSAHANNLYGFCVLCVKLSWSRGQQHKGNKKTECVRPKTKAFLKFFVLPFSWRVQRWHSMLQFRGTNVSARWAAVAYHATVGYPRSRKTRPAHTVSPGLEPPRPIFIAQYLYLPGLFFYFSFFFPCSMFFAVSIPTSWSIFVMTTRLRNGANVRITLTCTCCNNPPNVKRMFIILRIMTKSSLRKEDSCHDEMQPDAQDYVLACVAW